MTTTIHDLNPPDVVAQFLGTKKRRRKYGNRKVTTSEHVFDSQVEYDRFRTLELLQRAGDISGLQVHPHYVLLPGFKTASGTRHRAVTFKPDFEYVRGNQRVVEDVKAYRRIKGGQVRPHTTADFTLRRKLFQHAHPQVLFVIVYRLGGVWEEKEF